MPDMDTNALLIDIRERLVRLEERARSREERMERLETAVDGLNRFRWWILAGLGGAGGVGGALAKMWP